jgi:transglutaminase-like putative cysteine protease
VVFNGLLKMMPKNPRLRKVTMTNKPLHKNKFFNARRLMQLAGLAVVLTSQLVLAQTPAGLDAARWQSVDQHVLSAPADIEKNPAELARWLTQPFKTQPEKLRAIYRWITEHIEYDVQAYHENRSSTEDPQQVLSKHVSACEGYSNLFGELALHAGIKNMRKIDGYVKDARHQNGEAFDKSNHAWNAVQIDGEWLLIDSTWGAGYDAGDRYVKRFEPLYFLIRPEELRYSHFAQQPAQRFHDKINSISAFGALPYIPNTLLSVVNPQLLDSPTTQLPKTFDHLPGTFWIDQAPMTAVLKAGEPVRFHLRSDKLAEFALLNNDNWVFEPARPDGSKMIAQPAAGTLVLLGKEAGAANYKYLLQYEVRSK